MAKTKERKPLERKNWVASFTLIGEAKVGDYTFSIDQRSEKSDWIYNRMNLQVDCGSKYGKIDAQMMGGYGSERNNVIYVHGKDENGRDDFKNFYTIDWEDRFDDSILSDIGDLAFITVGLEKDTKDKTFYKKFLTPYDAIAYIQEHLENGMVVNVKGNLKYQLYNDTVTCQKEITSIVLSKAEPENYRANFTQTILIDKDSATKSDIDKDKGVLNVTAYVIEKYKEFNGYDLTNGGKVKGGLYVPLRKNYEFTLDMEKPEKTAAILSKIFKVKKGVDQVTFDGHFEEVGSTITTTIEDLPEDIVELIELGLYTEEEALTKCSTNDNKDRRMILDKPNIKLVGEEDSKTPIINRVENAYDEEDLLLDCLVPKATDDDEVPFNDDEDVVEEVVATEDDDLEALLAALD